MEKRGNVGLYIVREKLNKIYIIKKTRFYLQYFIFNLLNDITLVGFEGMVTIYQRFDKGKQFDKEINLILLSKCLLSLIL